MCGATPPNTCTSSTVSLQSHSMSHCTFQRADTRVGSIACYFRAETSPQPLSQPCCWHAAFSSVPTSALEQALSQCAYSAVPWGQCGGSSACPDFLNGTCTDQAWATVCCPPSAGYQQAGYPTPDSQPRHHQYCVLLSPSDNRHWTRLV